jgi:tRNA nucleotidyltransferase/poly(A) polymerase
MVPKLTEVEKRVRDLLLETVSFIQRQHPERRITLRIAGGWVRDKLLNQETVSSISCRTI